MKPSAGHAQLRLITLLAALLAMALAASAEITRQPYLQNMKPDSVVVMWRTSEPQETRVKFREQGTETWTVHYSTIPTTAHEITLPGLKPNTVYEYQVVEAGGESSLPPAAFQTFPAGPLADFQFAAYGDHRNNPAAHRSVVEAVLKTAEKRGMPRFIIDSGDLTGHGEHATDFYNEQFFDPGRDLMNRVCLFPVIGNHEIPGRQPRIPLRYFANFALPTDTSGTEYYYSFDFGDAHFCMIDAYSSDYSAGSMQHAWIDRDLSRSNKKWKFAMLHYPVFIHRSGPSVSYGNMDVREHLVPLFVKHGVTAVFSGDSHFYQRSEVDGIHYICTGGAGAPLYTPGSDMDYIRASKSVYHYTWITIKGDTMTLEAMDPNNERFDMFTTGPREAVKPEAPKLNYTRRMPDEKMKAGESLVIESRDAEGNVTAAPVYRESGGGWASSTAKSAAPGLKGQGSRFSDNNEGGATARITPPITSAGTYLVSVTVPNAGSVNAPNSLFTAGKSDDDPALVRGHVSLAAEGAGDKWHDIGLIELKPGDAFTLIEVDGEPDRFYFDAVRFTRYE